jgi:multidrug efflux pump subunit AcrA (membrane-fusion protein)
LKRGLGITALLLSGAVLASCGGAAGRHRGHRLASPGPAAVPMATAAAATVHPTVEIAGFVAPYQNVSISSPLSEPTDSVPVLEGDYVRKGQTLAVLDTADLRANLDAAVTSADSTDQRLVQTQYQAQLNIGQGDQAVRNAAAAVLQAQQSAKQAQQDLNRYQSLLKTGYVSQQLVDQQNTLLRNDNQQVIAARASLESAIINQRVNGSYQKGLQAANVASARADVLSARAQAEEIQTQIDKALVVSPVNGVVVNRNLNPGEYPGSRTIFTVQQLDPVYVELNASSQDVFRIPRGAPVAVAVAGVAGAEYRGNIDAVLGQVEPGSTNFTVQGLVANPGLRLKSGMAITGTVSLPAVSGIGIPSTAFLDDAHDTVMVVSAGGTAKTQKVTERGTDGKTSIVSGLASGTRVVSNGQLGIVAGQQIAGP